MNTYKQLLLQQANEVNSLLTGYIAIHNHRLKKGGTLISLLKNIFLSKTVEFDKIYSATTHLQELFDKKEFELLNIKKELTALSDLERKFLASLVTYFDALHETIQIFGKLTHAQYQGSMSAKNMSSFKENMDMEKQYEMARNKYVHLGQALMDNYNSLLKE